MPPNKLVKRASSVRGPREAYNQGAAALRPSFRRPATSHQRTATLQAHQNLTNDNHARLQRTAEDPASEGSGYAASTDSEAEYAQFFTTKITRERTLAKKRGSAALVGGFRRIFPDDKHLPTLVLAKSVRAGAPELDDSTSEDSGSVYLVSRPETPLSIAVPQATAANTHANATPARNAPQPFTDQPGNRAPSVVTPPTISEPAKNTARCVSLPLIVNFHCLSLRFHLQVL
jgi:hypothetical protein